MYLLQSVEKNSLTTFLYLYSLIIDIPGCPMSISPRVWDNLVSSQVGNRDHRLYGGSQYHRVLREFNLASRCLRLPTITEDEIANAAGVGDTHDGVNFLRASCVIALEKARTSFHPLLQALRVRMEHVMGKLYPVGEYMINQKQERVNYVGKDIGRMGSSGTDITQNPQFRQLIQNIYQKFVDKCSEAVRIIISMLYKSIFFFLFPPIVI